MNLQRVRINISIFWMRFKSYLSTLAVASTLGIIAFGAWSLFDSVLQSASIRSNMVASVPQQEYIVLTAFDSILVIAIGLGLYLVLDKLRSSHMV